MNTVKSERQRGAGLSYDLSTLSVGCPICLRSMAQAFSCSIDSLAMIMECSASPGAPPCRTETRHEKTNHEPASQTHILHLYHGGKLVCGNNLRAFFTLYISPLSSSGVTEVNLLFLHVYKLHRFWIKGVITALLNFCFRTVGFLCFLTEWINADSSK